MCHLKTSSVAIAEVIAGLPGVTGRMIVALGRGVVVVVLILIIIVTVVAVVRTVDITVKTEIGRIIMMIMIATPALVVHVTESSYYRCQRSRDRDYRPSHYDYREYEDERFFRDNCSYYHGDPHRHPDDFGEDYSVRFTPDGDDYLRSRSRSRSPSANGPTKDTVSDEKPKEPADSGSGDQSTAKQPKGNLKKLIDDYSSCKKSAEDLVTHPILENLVPVLESWWWEPFSKEDAKEIYAQCECPANVGPLHKVWINEEVYKKMGADGREADQTLCYINNSFTRGCQPLASCWGKLVRAEMVINDYNEADDKGNAVLGLPDATALNLTSLRTLLDLALQVLGMTNDQIVTSRRAVLKKYLNKDYHELCDKSHPIDYRMFGPNFKAQVEELNKFNKLASQVVTSAKSSAAKKKSPASQQYWHNHGRFLQRGRGSGGYSRPTFQGRGYGYFNPPAGNTLFRQGRSSRNRGSGGRPRPFRRQRY